MPPTVHSSRIEKPEGMSLTWKPRLVKTPTPTMSATTIAVATTTETEDPPPRSRPGHAALPASDVAMRPYPGLKSRFHGAGGCRRVQAALTSVKITWLIRYFDTYAAFAVGRGATALRNQSGGPTITTRLSGLLRASGCGEFFRKLEA